ncbi:MAG: GatB/YqeY domain-containing protein, partial [Patescibacteria group bacterium]
DKKIIPNKLASLFVNGKLNPNSSLQLIKDSYLKQTKTGITIIKDLDFLVNKIIEENPENVTACETNPNAIGPLIGKVIALSKGQADPVTVRQILTKKLVN